MDMSNIRLNHWYDNYRILCEELGMKQKSGTQKGMQIVELARRYKLKKSGNSFMFTEKYRRPLPYEDVEELMPKFNSLDKTDSTLTQFHWLPANRYKNTSWHGITRLSNERFWWYCWDCERNAYASPKERLAHPHVLSNKVTVCHYCELSTNAKKVYDTLLSYDCKFVTEYSFPDLRGIGNGLLRFDFAILNNEDTLIGLIEYDGEYHDEKLNPCKGNYHILSEHDARKDAYCAEKNIPLLRIHHTEIAEYKDIISDYLLRLGIKKRPQTARDRKIVELENELYDLLVKFRETQELLNKNRNLKLLGEDDL